MSETARAKGQCSPSGRERVLVGMSGGVDSSVAAALCLESGEAEVAGAYMKNWINEEQIVGHCPWQEDVEDARAVATQLGIPFHVVNMTREYRERIVRYMIDGYCAGITPNPDVFCNREMKFGRFLDWATAHGFDAVATGHYARRRRASDGSWDIIEGADPAKDQSYFLAMLEQRQIQKARFPVGELKKSEVRTIAAERRLPNAQKKDSQGICFIGNVKMSDFLRQFVPDNPGEIVDPAGRVLGMHRGLHLYTLGQRRGLGVASPVAHTRYVVVAKVSEHNQLVVALDDGNAPGLYSTECTLTSLSFTNKPLDALARIEARPRYRAPRSSVTVEPLANNRMKVVWSVPQRALTPGQICALYDGATMLGGGIFETIVSE